MLYIPTVPLRSFHFSSSEMCNIQMWHHLLWIQLVGIRYQWSLVTGERIDFIHPSPFDAKILISRDPMNRRIQIKTTVEPCSSYSDDDYIGGYTIDPCTGRVTNQNYWRLTNKESPACPTTAPTLSISTTPPTKSPASLSKQYTKIPTVVTFPSSSSHIPTIVTLTPNGPMSPTGSRSSLKPSLNTMTQLPTVRSGPTIDIAPSRSRKSLLPTVRTGPTIDIAPSVSSKTQLPTVTLGRPISPTVPTTLHPAAFSSLISSKPTLSSHGNNTVIDPIGKNPRNSTDSNNNAIALGLGLAAFAGLALLVSRLLWKRKTILQRSKLEDDEEGGEVTVSEPDKGSHVGDCHRTSDGMKWFDPSCPLCQETLLRRKAEEELLAQGRKMSVDVHYCSSAICDKCHRSKENDVTFISTLSDEVTNNSKNVITRMDA